MIKDGRKYIAIFYIKQRKSNAIFTWLKKKLNLLPFLFKMQADSYAYLPPNFQHSLMWDASATLVSLVVFERRYVSHCVIIDWMGCNLFQTFHFHCMLKMRIHSGYLDMPIKATENFVLWVMSYSNIETLFTPKIFRYMR